MPWEKAKGFDGSAIVGDLIPVASLKNINDLNFHLTVNNETRQTGNINEMIHSLDAIIAHVSQYFTLKQGDLIFTGTPKGVAAVKPGDQLVGYLNNQELLRFDVK